MLRDNNPTFTWISWNNLLITYDKNTYQIQNSETNMKYVYWDITNPYDLQCYNKTQKQRPGFYQLFINENGIGTERSHEDLIISWNGNNPDLIAKQIFGLHEENKATGNKFMAMERDIDGIRDTVGNAKEEMGKLTENISQIKQQADNIDSSVKKITQEFTNNKEVNELRENLNKSMIDYNAALGLFKSEIYTYYKDNTISNEEKIKINTHLDIMDLKKSEVIKYVDVVIRIMESQNQTTKVNQLNSAKTKFINAINNLRKYITLAMSDTTIVPSEIIGITDLFAKCTIAINEVKNVCDECIFLGAGGRITEELARIGIKSNEIVLSVSETETNIKNNLSIKKNLLQGNITDLRNVVNNLISGLNKVSEDGAISTEENVIINGLIENVEREKLDLDASYNELYNDVNISSSVKAKLHEEHIKFNNSFSNMKNKINEVKEDSFINDAEVAQALTSINEFLTAITNYHPILCQAIDNIGENKVSAEIKAAKEELQGNIDDVNKEIGGLNDYVNGTFENNILDQAERKAILSSKESLTIEKVDVDNKYNTIYENINLISPYKEDFKTKYDDYVLKFNNLITIIDNILSKESLIDNTDRDNYNSAIQEHNSSLALFVKQTNICIDEISKKTVLDTKEALAENIKGVSSAVSDLNSYVDGAFLDGVLSRSEKEVLSQSLKVLDTEKLDVDKQYLFLYGNIELIDTIKRELKIAYDDYIVKFNSLVGIINELILKDNITEIDKETYSEAYRLHNISLGEFSAKSNKAVDAIADKKVSSAKSSLQEEIKDVYSSIESLESVMNTAFKDGILSDSEKLAMKQNLQTIAKEKTDVDKQYESVYNNVDLLDDEKVKLKNSYDNYSLNYHNLISVINNILNKEGLIDSADQNNLNDAFNKYRVSSGEYSLRVNAAIDSIAKVKADKAKDESKVFTEAKIKILNESINSKVSSEKYNLDKTEFNRKISEINQESDRITSSVEVIKNDYVDKTTFSQFSNKITATIQTTSGINFIDNPVFNSGDLRKWTLWGSPSWNIIEDVSLGFRYSLKLQCFRRSEGVTQIVKGLVYGKKYTARCMVYVEEGVPGIMVRNHDQWGGKNFSPDTGYGAWTELSFTFTAREGTTPIYIGNILGKGVCTFWTSKIFLYEGSEYIPFQDNQKELYSNIMTLNEDELRCDFEDSTYAKMGRDGFAWWTNGMSKPYHCLAEAGWVNVGIGEWNSGADAYDLKITLPNYFKGKVFTPVSMIQGWYVKSEYALNHLVVDIPYETINYSQGTFVIRVKALTRDGSWQTNINISWLAIA